MGDIARRCFFVLGKILRLPLLIPLMLISQKQVIAADTKALAVNLKMEYGSLVSNILRLLGIKEFRNLYYFRLMEGGPIIKALLCILKIIYPGRQDLLIDPSCRIGGAYLSSMVTARSSWEIWAKTAG